jgi:zinc protease
MSYAKRIKVHSLRAGGTALISSFPSRGMVSIVGSVAGGARLAGSDVLAQMHAAMLLEGTKKRNKTAIQIALDSMGASLSFAVERDRLTFSAHVRDVYLKRLLMIITEVLKEPSFPARELSILKERTTAELSLEGQDTRAQAGINLSHLLYDPEHPNYQTSTEESRIQLDKMSRVDLVKFHARAISRASLVVSATGEMSGTELLSMIESSFSKLPKADIQIPSFAPAERRTARSTAVHIEDKASIDYMLGVATGITKDHPDYPALMLGLQVLGNRSGFTGRLMKTVREIEGLTYGVYAYPAGFASADGFITVWATFAPQLYERGKTAVIREVRLIVEKGVTDIEVKKHRTMYEARSRVTLANSGDLARAAHDITIEGHTPSWLDAFPKQVLKLSAKQVNAALKKYLIITDLSESAAGPIPKV